MTTDDCIVTPAKSADVIPFAASIICSHHTQPPRPYPPAKVRKRSIRLAGTLPLWFYLRFVQKEWEGSDYGRVQVALFRYSHVGDEVDGAT
jgi:hypothetical protein